MRAKLGWKGGGKGDWSQGEEDKGDSFDFFLGRIQIRFKKKLKLKQGFDCHQRVQ